MRTITKDEAVEFLIRRKIPDYQYVGNSLGNTFLWNQSGIPEDEREAYVENVKKLVAGYREELIEMPAEKFESFFMREQAAADDEMLQSMALNAGQEMEADFNHWSKAAYWERNEAVALVLGVNPMILDQQELIRRDGHSNFVEKWANLHDLVDRALKAELLSEPTRPACFLKWAEQYEIEVPQGLVELVERRINPRAKKTDPEAVTTEAHLDAANILESRSPYWKKLSAATLNAVESYPQWKASEDRKIQKSGNLSDFLNNVIGLNTREAEIVKKILSDIYQELK